tara:strand:+ start:571 stop:1155 length:585 start_codon:yes stop_codon:yes gene_type:complete
MSNNIYTLYLKTHNRTGLKYLGYTKQDPYTYKGSGVLWLKHIKEYTNDVSTAILYQTEDADSIPSVGIHLSDVYNIVNNPWFANLKIESGPHLFFGNHSLAAKRKMSEKKLNYSAERKADIGKRISDTLTGFKHSDETKAKMAHHQKTRVRKKSSYDKASATFKAMPPIECPHCGKVGGVTGMRSWHFENCRNK